MKKNKKIVAATLMVCMVLSLVACAGKTEKQSKNSSDNGAANETYNWDFFLSLPQTYVRNEGLLEFVDNIKDQTENHVNISVYSAGELPYTGTEAIDICSTGTVQMSDANTANIAGTSKTGAICTYPFLCSDWESFHTMMDTITPYFTKEMEEQGIHVLFFMPDSLQYMFGKGSPLTSWSEMKGRSMRGQNSYMQQFASLVDANSVAITSNEIATAISKGVIDSFVTSSMTTESSAYYEFIDWANKTPFSANGSFIMVNQSAWDSIPEEYQKIIEDEGSKLTEKYWNTFIPEEDKKALDIIEENNTKVTDIDENLSAEGRKIVEGYYTKWADEAGGQAPETLKAVYEALGY
ncbi:TRAP transporter substrate-binding protein [Hespellia stercorisuis]|uniref:TRAP-type C4-dicarboxylate transport system, substrate-binding protein n=1 Tax=Hespellia stercorisuis DSM 15480 TaxID=1121950 RepID=A0A1M6KB23_9FIRM|nr:TRAP transporter substrate-binding protein [Hespellia stercorisuis]SHJ56097.1 TRAP-type C4-dicarboxylate transport system, substrate-binding protein [Hespellia stercorisuis DSM 15480]